MNISDLEWSPREISEGMCVNDQLHEPAALPRGKSRDIHSIRDSVGLNSDPDSVEYR
jgi:hypothetical protein